jgi:hypothetical protein
MHSISAPVRYSRSGRLIRLADRRSIARLCPFRCLGKGNYRAAPSSSTSGTRTSSTHGPLLDLIERYLEGRNPSLARSLLTGRLPSPRAPVPGPPRCGGSFTATSNAHLGFFSRALAAFEWDWVEHQSPSPRWTNQSENTAGHPESDTRASLSGIVMLSRKRRTSPTDHGPETRGVILNPDCQISVPSSGARSGYRPAVSKASAARPVRLSARVNSSVSKGLHAGGQRCPALPDLPRPDKPKRRNLRQPLSVVQVFVARQPAIYRLPQQIGQRQLGVACARVGQVPFNKFPEARPFVQLPHHDQSTIRSHP